MARRSRRPEGLISLTGGAVSPSPHGLDAAGGASREGRGRLLAGDSLHAAGWAFQAFAPVKAGAAFQFARSGADALRTSIAKASRAAGIPLWSPHDLRHRRISLMHLRGRPWARIGEFVGQRGLTVTANTHTHELVRRGRARLRLARVEHTNTRAPHLIRWLLDEHLAEQAAAGLVATAKTRELAAGPG